MTQPLDEQPRLKELQAQASRLVKPLDALRTYKSKGAPSLVELTKLAANLPAPEAFIELRQEWETFLAAARQQRGESFGRAERAFLKQAEAAGKPCREGNNSWRVGLIEMEVDRAEAKARFLYNREVLQDWAPVAGPDDLSRMEAEALGLLGKADLPDETIADLFLAAHSEAARHRKEGRVANPERIPVTDLHQALHFVLIRREVAGQKPGKRLTGALELPKWHFLFLLDRYRSLIPTLPRERRLSFETGTQAEITKGLGARVGGLDPQRDYQILSFVLPPVQ